MQTMSVQEAQGQLGEIVAQLAPGEEIVLMDANRPVARLVGANDATPTPIPGRCKGMLTTVQEDDDHLKDWAEYMP